jgi:hypothetical protein
MPPFAQLAQHAFSPWRCWCLALLLLFLLPGAWAQTTVCAKVKIEIKQELTLERQAFDAEMKINNTTDTSVIENVSVVVKVTDENGTPVSISDNPNDLAAKFFVRLTGKQNIANVEGTGTVSPKTTSVINWLLIPAPGSAGSTPLGKKYLVGATLKYRFGGDDTVLEVAPDVITVKPLPLLALDYFLTQDVVADDPLTAAIEPTEPFTLGVRVKNNGLAAAKNLKIDSAQPKIIENNQGLLINFTLTGSYVNDAPAQNSLLINFGDIAAGTSTMGRWTMETTLAGKFTEFTARFSHADELGGALTSLVQATNAHFLIRDVRVDLPGRDAVRDFLAQDGDVLRVYESDGADALVTDRSAAATLVPAGGVDGRAAYGLSFAPTDGFVYVRLPDPYEGSKALGAVIRSDAKQLLLENVWLSKTRNLEAKRWEYWVNFFDVNSSGQYRAEFAAPPVAGQPPVLQFIPDRTVQEGRQVSFLVEASSPQGLALTLTAAPLPAGARFIPQASDSQTPTLARAVLDWTPGVGSAGSYVLNYTASDGSLRASRAATIKVESSTALPGPGTPTIVSPLPGAQVVSLRPVLSVQTSAVAQDPSSEVQFEVFADEAFTQLVASARVPKAQASAGNGAGAIAVPTTWTVATALNDNTRYGWRARAFSGSGSAALFSPWVVGRFFVNTVNDAPDSFNLTSPVPNAQVSSLTPVLGWTNSVDKDNDAISYSVEVYRNAALTDVAAQVQGLAQGANGSTEWTLTPALLDRKTYYWRVFAVDTLGAKTASIARPFAVKTGNAPPTEPLLISPVAGALSSTTNPQLTVQNSTDADQDVLTYVFEIDTANTFDTENKRTSGKLAQTPGSTRWTAPNLVENQRYWWRVKAQDGQAESAWAVGEFLVSTVNDPPPTPTLKNPGNGAWSAVLQPTLEVNPVVDPEGQAIYYRFEVYKDAKLTQPLGAGTSQSPAWMTPFALADKSMVWWRVQAVDVQNAASPWSAPAAFTVSTGPYQNPRIALSSPATPVVPEVVANASGPRKQIRLQWEGQDTNTDPTVALYYSTSPSGFGGSLIVDGLRQNVGNHVGSFVWDVTDLASGTYYVYAVIYDPKGLERAYAPGAVVVTNPAAGNAIAVSHTALSTSETGAAASFTVRLTGAPSSDVTLGLSATNAREGALSTEALTFTPTNWAAPQTVVVTGLDNCAPDGNTSYQLVFGKAVSLDANYAALQAPAITVTNSDAGDKANTTNSPAISVCNYALVASRKIAANDWEYVFKWETTNRGPALSGLEMRLSGLPASITIAEPSVTLGAVSQGETLKSARSMSVRSKTPLFNPLAYLRANAKWLVVPTLAP